MWGFLIILDILKKIGFDQHQAESVKNMLYIFHCEEKNIIFNKNHTDSWINSLNLQSTKEAFNWLNDSCQNNMLRPENVERLQYNPPDFIIKNLSEMMEMLKMFRICETIFPECKKYDAMLLLGASQEAFERRVKTAIEILHHGYNIPEMYILSGDRDLWPKHEPITPILVAEKITKKMQMKSEETKEIYKHICSLINKYLPEDAFKRNNAREINKIREAIVDIYENPYSHKDINHFYPIKWPNEMVLGRTLTRMYKLHHIIDIFDVDTPKNEQGKRPNTYDTYMYFERKFGQKFQNKGYKPKLLLISNQPYSFYQKIIAENSLPPNKYEIDIAGASSLLIGPKSVAICLDLIARSIYAARSRFLE